MTPTSLSHEVNLRLNAFFGKYPENEEPHAVVFHYENGGVWLAATTADLAIKVLDEMLAACDDLDLAYPVSDELCERFSANPGEVKVEVVGDTEGRPLAFACLWQIEPGMYCSLVQVYREHRLNLQPSDE